MAKEEVKDFDAEMGVSEAPAHPFKVGGREWHIRNYIPPAAFLDSESAQDNLSWFVATALVSDEREAFLALMKDPDSGIDFNIIPKMSGWVMEKMSGRPTASPVSSGNGAGGTSSGSKENSSSQDATTGA